MKHLIVLAWMTLISSSCFSQTYTEVSGGLTPRINYRLSSEYSDVEGSPYLNDVWKPGRIVHYDSTFIRLSEVNLDLTSNSFLFKERNSIYRLPILEEINLIHLGNDRFVIVRIDEKPVRFMKLLVEGSKLSILELLSCKLVKGTPSRGFIEGTKDEFVTYKSYFIRNSMGQFFKINPRKATKSLPSLIPDQKIRIQEFLEKEKIKLKDLQVLIKLANYLNTKTN